MKPRPGVNETLSVNEKAEQHLIPSLLRSKTTLDLTNCDEQKIRELAFRFYQERGRIAGHDLEDWLQAEAIVRRWKLAA